MTKTDIIRKIERNTGYPYVEIREIIDELTYQIKNALVAGNKVIIQGLMSMNISQLRPRLGRNPKTGEIEEFEASRVVKVRISDDIRKAVNGKRDTGDD